MAEGKWIEGLTPDMDQEDAARQALGQRFEIVTRYLPMAIHKADQDEEYVHQLRVASRRADACLRIFRACLPGRVYHWVRGQLRTIRRAAGQARDCDVFLLALKVRTTEAKSAQLPGLNCLIAYLLGQRAIAQAELQALDAEEFDKAAAGMLDAIRSPHDHHPKTLAELASTTIGKLLDKLEKTTEENLEEYDKLHQVRIAGKRLRYAIEILVDCFPAEMKEEVYPQIEMMQEILGDANDSHNAIAMLQALRQQLKPWPNLRASTKPGIERVLRFHQRRMPQDRKRFLAWLEKWRRVVADGVVGGALSTNHGAHGKE